MCTAFVKKGKDIIVGFNFDMNVGGMDYCPIIEKDRVMLGMRLPDDVLSSLPDFVRIKNGIRLIQGVSSGGNVAGQLCNMDFNKIPKEVTDQMVTIDQVTDDFVTEHQSCSDILNIMEKYNVTNIPNNPLALHSLFVDPKGNVVFVEPGNGYAVIKENYFTVTNFSILEAPLDLTDDKAGYYGVDRYRTSLNILKNSTEDFDVSDGLSLLESVKQTGEWGTRFSFVYSYNENAVYYCVEGDFRDVKRQQF